MGFKALILALLFSAVGAQAVSDPTIQQLVAQLQAAVPTCAFDCIFAAVPQSTCALTNNTCICTDPELNTAILSCVASTCTVREQLSTAKFQTINCGQPIHDIGGELRTTNWVLFGLSVVFVVGRLTARLPQLGSHLAWDDYWIILATLGNTAGAAVIEKLVQYGLGRDMWMIEPQDNITNVLKFFFVAEVLYAFVMMATKISILLLYLRIFPSKSFQIQCYILIALSIGHAFAGWLAQPFICQPTPFFWEQWNGEVKGSCPVNMSAQLYAMASTNIAIDLAIWVIPIPQLIPLQMSWKRKFGIGLIFLVGLFETLCSVLRMWTITVWGNSVNPTLDYQSLGLWSLIELDVGIICACMPGMAALLKRTLPGVFGSTRGSGSGSGRSDSNSLSKRSAGESSNWSSTRDRMQRIGSPFQNHIRKTTDVSVSYRSDSITPDGGDEDGHYELVTRKESQTYLRPLQLDMSQLESQILPPKEARMYREKW